MSRDRDDLADTLAGLGIPVAACSAAPIDLDDVYDQIGTLGTATGHGDEAADLVASMRTEIDDLIADAPTAEALGGEAARSTLLLRAQRRPRTRSRRTTFIGERAGLAGLTSIADGVDPAAGGVPPAHRRSTSSTPTPSSIFLAHTDGTGRTPTRSPARPGWADLPAVQNGHVVVLDPDIASPLGAPHRGPHPGCWPPSIDATGELAG